MDKFHDQEISVQNLSGVKGTKVREIGLELILNLEFKGSVSGESLGLGQCKADLGIVLHKSSALQSYH